MSIDCIGFVVLLISSDSSLYFVHIPWECVKGIIMNVYDLHSYIYIATSKYTCPRYWHQIYANTKTCSLKKRRKKQEENISVTLVAQTGENMVTAEWSKTNPIICSMPEDFCIHFQCWWHYSLQVNLDGSHGCLFRKKIKKKVDWHLRLFYLFRSFAWTKNTHSMLLGSIYYCQSRFIVYNQWAILEHRLLASLSNLAV